MAIIIKSNLITILTTNASIVMEAIIASPGNHKDSLRIINRREKEIEIMSLSLGRGIIEIEISFRTISQEERKENREIKGFQGNNLNIENRGSQDSQDSNKCIFRNSTPSTKCNTAS